MIEEKLIKTTKRLTLLAKHLIEFIETEQRFNPDMTEAFLEFAKISEKEMPRHKLHSFWKERVNKQKV
jgi:hypothetical protein